MQLGVRAAASRWRRVPGPDERGANPIGTEPTLGAQNTVSANHCPRPEIPVYMDNHWLSVKMPFRCGSLVFAVNSVVSVAFGSTSLPTQVCAGVPLAAACILSQLDRNR